MARRHVKLRQIEAFKAVIEHGSVSSAARVAHISQPAMSKLIAYLEADAGLKLFDRVKGRLAPTECGMRLYEEIARIFAGVRQVENAIDAIRREEQGRLAIGVMPALAGSFIQRATTAFRKGRPNVFCSVQSLSSQWIVDWVVASKLDVGLVKTGITNPYVTLEPLMEHPLVCIMPLNHPLAAKREIEPGDLERTAFVAFHPDTYEGHLIEGVLEEHGVSAEIVLVTNVSPTLVECVAGGMGISLVHPLDIIGLEQRLIVRPFRPEIPLFNFQLCHAENSRSAHLVDTYARAVRATAAEISKSLVMGS